MDNIRTVLRQVRAVIMTSANLGPRTVIAVVRASLADIDIWQKNGVSRDEIASVLTERYGVSITLTAFDKALYRARKELKSRLHNSTKQEDKKPDRKWIAQSRKERGSTASGLWIAQPKTR